MRAARAGYPQRTVLEAFDLTIERGDHLAVLGPSGVGKSTLLRLIYDALEGQAALIPQEAALVPQLSVFHNVYMGRLDRYSTARNLRMLVWPDRQTRGEIDGLLARVDLAGTTQQRAGALSGGQAQRVSVARALYNGRPVVIGDEPVSALDRAQGGRVLSILTEAHQTSVLALHDTALALEYATRVLVLGQGRILLDAPAAGLTADGLARFYRAGL